jgi:pimeloyl-ACP methyl ester carboxylesterase
VFAPQLRDEFEDQAGPIKILLRKPNSARPPVLFVPGSFSGAWIWRGNFLEYFHEAGFEVAAMSFGGHGQRGWNLWRRGLQAYERDLEAAIAQMRSPPIVIAHSLGGLIAQRVAYRRPLAALGLLSPIPLHGVADSVLALAKKSPASVLKLGAVALEPRLSRLVDAPLGIYSSRMSKEARTAVTRRLQAESPLALGQSLFPRITNQPPPPCPLKFWGAEGDHIIPASEVRRAARDMRAEVRIFPGMSHNMQCEPEWRDVADDILTWIGSLSLGERDRSRKTRSPQSGHPAKGRRA